MRNDFLGTSIDGDARAACGCHHHGSNTINTAGCGCDNNSRQSRGNGGCSNSRQGRSNGKSCDCDNSSRQGRGNGCNDCDNDYSRQGRSNCKSCDCDNSSRQGRGNSCNDCDNDYSRQGRSNGKSCDCDNSSRQGRGNGCNDCDNSSRQGRGNGCNDCDNDYSRQGRSNGDGCSCNGRTPAMVYAQQHDLDNMYRSEKALIRGTLFGCLDKPMCNEQCTDNACTTQCQEDKFSIWELRLYLNTHPCDQKALAMLNRLTEQMDEDCGCTFTSDCSRWSWLDGPWPWEYQRCCGKEA